MKPVLFALPIALAILMPTAASAKETCTIEQFQAIDIQPDTKGGVLDKESGQFLITEKPPMRCSDRYVHDVYDTKPYRKPNEW